MEERFYKVSEISEIFGLPCKVIRDMCYARGQRFAFKPGGAKATGESTRRGLKNTWKGGCKHDRY